MRADVAAVDDGARFVDAHTQRFVDAFPDAATRPVRETIVDVVPRAKALREITPGNSGLRAIQDRLDEFPVAEVRASALLCRQYCLEALPLLVGERVPSHDNV